MFSQLQQLGFDRRQPIINRFDSSDSESEEEEKVIVPESILPDDEEEEEKENENDDYGEEQNEEDGEPFVDEFGAFGAGGRSGGRIFQYADNEIDQFWINMEQYTKLNNSDFDRQKNPFLNLVQHYPHPRTLNPALCDSMYLFYKEGRYIWNEYIYRKHRDKLPSSFHVYRYIQLFNTFAL